MNEEVVVIGASCVDVSCENVSDAIFRDGHLHCDGISVGYGGDGLNEAVCLSALGKRVKLITKLGRDDAGEQIMNYCRKSGVLIDEECLDDTVRTYVTVVLIEEDGQRDLLGTGTGSLRELSLKDVKLPLSEEIRIVSFASLFISPKFTLEDMEILFRELKREGKLIVLDTTTPKNGEKLEDLKGILPFVDYFLPNEKEAFMITGCDTIEEAAEKLFQAGTAHVGIKAGERGCYLRSESMKRYIPAASVDHVRDTTGAGDSFVAGFISGILDGLTPEECAERGNRCGAMAVQHVGATAWTKELQ